MATTDSDLNRNRSARAEELFRALRSGDAAEAARVLKDDSSLAHEHNSHDFDASTMILAAIGGSTEAVDLLLSHGVDVNSGSLWWAGSFSPLMSAILHKNQAMVQHLIERGATVHAYEAAAMGDVAALVRLLECDPELARETGGDGQTPLHVAANVEIARILLDHGAEIDALDVDHRSTPAQYAAFDRPEVARFLIEEGAKADPILLAAIGDPSRLEQLLEEDPEAMRVHVGPGIFPTEPPAAEIIYAYSLGNGCTLLHSAAASGNAEAVRVLCAKGADPNARGRYDDAAPLRLAAWHDRPEAIRALVLSGAEIDIPSGPIHHNTPLGWAIVGGSASAVKVLLELGARPSTHHLNDAISGVEGAFQQYRRVELSARREIGELLRNAISG